MIFKTVHALAQIMGPPYVIGIDGGTESVRAGVFDANGTLLKFAACPYITTHPEPGWAEQVSFPSSMTNIKKKVSTSRLLQYIVCVFTLS